MTYSIARYNELVAETFKKIEELAHKKGGEYAGDTDRLANFRRNGEALGVPMETIWAVYAAKHWDAIMQHIQDLNTGKTRERMEPLSGRVDDLIVYLLLFKARLEETDNSDDGWIEWNGRGNIPPVSVDTLVEWRRENMLPEQTIAGNVVWANVFEYRVITGFGIPLNSENWTVWFGGRNPPVPPDTMIDWKLRNGSEQQHGEAGKRVWTHDGDGADIVAYRLTTKAPKC